jgi:hypothetical protein
MAFYYHSLINATSNKKYLAITVHHVLFYIHYFINSHIIPSDDDIPFSESKKI